MINNVYGNTFAICGTCFAPLDKADSATDGEPCCRGYLPCEKHPKSATLYVDKEYPTSSEYGPTLHAKCPNCQNSLQNAIPDGSPHLRRCASCKTLWHYYPKIQEPFNFKDMSDAEAKAILRHAVNRLYGKVHLTVVEKYLIDRCVENLPSGH